MKGMETKLENKQSNHLFNLPRNAIDNTIVDVLKEIADAKSRSENGPRVRQKLRTTAVLIRACLSQPASSFVSVSLPFVSSVPISFSSSVPVVVSETTSLAVRKQIVRTENETWRYLERL